MSVIIERDDFSIHRIGGYITNIYLVDYGETMFLLDGGVAGDMEEIEKYLSQVMGRSPGDITLAVVSHMHPDHPGGLVKLRQKYGIPIASHYLASRWYAGPGGLIQYVLDCLMTLGVGRRQKMGRRKVRFSRYLRPEYPMEGGDTLPFFGGWEILHLPGHTSHDIAVYHREEKIIFLGDLLINIKGGYHLPMPIVFRDRMRNSFLELAEKGYATVLVSHGDEIFGVDLKRIFGEMTELLDRPLSSLAKKVQLLSLYSQQIWKYRIAEKFSGSGKS